MPLLGIGVIAVLLGVGNRSVMVENLLELPNTIPRVVTFDEVHDLVIRHNVFVLVVHQATELDQCWI